MEKHCNNSQFFKEKNYKVKFLISSILKKIDKDNFRKKITKKTQNKGKQIMLKTL
jgi:Txe/YoeB family toxin of Txe-Axe toxin-antitoxin module